MANISYSVTVTISDSDNKIFESIGSVPEVLQKACQHYLPRYAQGGFLIEPAHADRIQKANKDLTLNSLEITKYMERTKGLEDGQRTFKIQIDPALYTPIEELAHSQNVSVQALLSDAVNLMMANGWLYQAVPLGGYIHMDASQRSQLSEIFGRPAAEISTADILAALRKEGVE